MGTSERIISAALVSFGTRGYEATSLDALANELGVRKQTILYHFGSKEGLLEAVIDRAAGDLSATLDEAVRTSGEGWDRVEAVVNTVFRVATRRPELLALVRECARLGDRWSIQASEALEPLVKRATEFLDQEISAGNLRASEPKLLLASCYSTVMGAATEVEILRAIGIEPSLRETVRRRREMLRFLHSALMP